MCDGREPDREIRRDETQALQEIRRLFARYRQVARHGMVTERDETADEPEEDRAFAGR